MAKIILITAANREAGERQREWTLGYRPLQWCRDKLRLDSEPLGPERIILVPNPSGKKSIHHVFVEVDKNEKGSLAPGFYPSSLGDAKVRELLRDELHPVTSDSSSSFRVRDESTQKTLIKVVHIAKPFSKRIIHHPGKIEQIFHDGQEVTIALPLCGNIDESPVAGNIDVITTCNECRSIAGGATLIP